MAALEAPMAALALEVRPKHLTGYRTHTCEELRMANVGATVKLCGWVQNSRDMNHFAFVDLRDRYGITQIVCVNTADDPVLKANYELARGLGREFVIAVEGTVVERSAKNAARATVSSATQQYLQHAPFQGSA